jgi:hypothetical protein
MAEFKTRTSVGYSVLEYRLLLTDVYCICCYIMHIHPNKLVVEKVREKSGRLPAKLNIL